MLRMCASVATLSMSKYSNQSVHDWMAARLRQPGMFQSMSSCTRSRRRSSGPLLICSGGVEKSSTTRKDRHSSSAGS